MFMYHHRALIFTLGCLYLLVCGALSSCSSRGRERVLGQGQVVRSKGVAESVISNTSSAALRWEDYSLEGKSWFKIQMEGTGQGWLASHDGALYKTTDAGETWERVKNFIVPEQGYPTDMFFLGRSGWVAISKNEIPFDEHTGEVTFDNITWIVHTNDAGQNWETQYVAPGNQITQVRFMDGNKGWAIGRRFATSFDDTDKGLILHSTDSGKTWVDLSHYLPVDMGGIQEMSITEPGELTLITSDNSIYRTMNEGQSWDLVITLQDIEDQVSMFQIERIDGARLWVLGGTAGLEGTWSVVAEIGDDNLWRKYVVSGAYLRQAIFLPGNKTFACGSVLNTSVSPARREGVILYSTNAGRSWVKVYHDPEVPFINSLSAVDSHYIWASGERGLLLRLHTSETE